jgi:signal transduction histidine kinase
MSDEKGRRGRRSSRQGGSSPPSGGGAGLEEIHHRVHALSHDLRNPLGSILGYVELLRDTAEGALSAEHLGFLKRIEENCREMLDELARFTAELDERVRRADSASRPDGKS